MYGPRGPLGFLHAHWWLHRELYSSWCRERCAVSRVIAGNIHPLIHTQAYKFTSKTKLKLKSTYWPGLRTGAGSRAHHMQD